MPAKKTADELQQELNARKLKDEIRKESDNAYAIKLVEKIVFTMIALILVAVATAIISLVIRK